MAMRCLVHEARAGGLFLVVDMRGMFKNLQPKSRRKLAFRGDATSRRFPVARG
jgi:hypothetical protein